MSLDPTVYTQRNHGHGQRFWSRPESILTFERRIASVFTANDALSRPALLHTKMQMTFEHSLELRGWPLFRIPHSSHHTLAAVHADAGAAHDTDRGGGKQDRYMPHPSLTLGSRENVAFVNR